MISPANLPESLGGANAGVEIRGARPEEFEELGRLVASVYSTLDGFPDKDEQPEYHEMLADIGRFADNKPDSSLLVAVSEKDELLGGVVGFSDMAQ